MAGDVGERPGADDELNVYARVIVDEASRRGIDVTVVDPETGELLLAHGGRTITTFESLSELTSAVAFRRCDHKWRTREVLRRAGLSVAPGRLATFDGADLAFLDEHRDVVVKPARGEQGWGITVGVTEADDLRVACEDARRISADVVIEQRVPGEDLRVVVIGGEVVAASVRRPPAVIGDGERTLGSLIEELSATREEATDGASTIPLDDTTRSVVADAGVGFDSVLDEGVEVEVRHTANLHTGGTITDVTDELHPALATAARATAEALAIPVVGVDLMVAAIDGPAYVVIEANEQPGLAHHEPRPTVERFVDLLFPATRRR